jgi:hypothetical protein
MRLEVANLFIGIHSGLRKRSAVIGMHFVSLSLQQIGTADVYSPPSNGPSSSNSLLETVDDVYDTELVDLPFENI